LRLRTPRGDRAWRVESLPWYFPEFHEAQALEAAEVQESAMSQENVEIVRRSFDARARIPVEVRMEFGFPFTVHGKKARTDSRISSASGRESASVVSRCDGSSVAQPPRILQTARRWALRIRSAT
jgi:hypothetical protein